MAEDRIQYKDFVDGKQIRSDWEKDLKQMEKAVRDSYARMKKEFKGLFKDTTDVKKIQADVEKLKKLVAELSATKKAEVAVNKQLEQSQHKLTMSEQKGSQAMADNTEKTRQNKRERSLQAKVNNAAAGSLDKLKAKTNLLNSKLNKLNLTTKEGRKQAKLWQRQILANTNALKKSDKAIGRHTRNVGNYSSAMSGLPGPLGLVGHGISMVGRALKFVATPLGLATVALAGFAVVLGKSIKKAIEFQKANAELAAILGKSRGEIKSLNYSAKILGATTAFTATQVVRLQIAYAKLGFAEQAIIDMSKATIDLSIVSKKGADEVAKYVGSVIKIFGLLATNATMVADVSAKSFSSSALDFEKLSHGMSIVGPIANAMGESFEKTTAKLGVLADRGLDASVSGTALRNIYLELSKEGLTWNEAMEMISSSQNKAAEALELFGKRGAVAGLIMAEAGDQVEKLEYRLNNAGGTAEHVANEQLLTLSGQTTLMKSAWDGFLLSIEDGEGVMGKMVGTIIDLTTGFLNLITPTRSFADKLNSLTREYIYQTDKATKLFKATMKLAEGSDERAESIKQLNLQYMDYLPSILKENTTNLQLQASQILVNEAIEDNILLKQRQALLSDLTNEKIGKETKAFTEVAKFAKSRGIESYQEITDLYNKLINESSTYTATSMGMMGEKIENTYNSVNKEVERSLGVPEYLLGKHRFTAILKDILSDVQVATGDYNESLLMLDATMQALGITESQIAVREEAIEKKRKQRAQERFLTASISDPSASPEDALAAAITLKNIRLKVAQEEYDEGVLLKEEFEAKKLEIENSYTAIAQSLGVSAGGAGAGTIGALKIELSEATKALDGFKESDIEGITIQRSLIKVLERRLELLKLMEAYDPRAAFIGPQPEGARTRDGVEYPTIEPIVPGEEETPGEMAFREADEEIAAARYSELEKEEIRQAGIDSAYAAYDAIFDIGANFRERELIQIEKQRQNELELAGDNQEEIDRINTKYNEKAAKVKTKQAKADKVKALFDIGISTAVGIAKSIPNPFLIAFSAIIGAIQLAVVASKPIPQFKKGIKKKKESGWAITSEGGEELIITPEGVVEMTSDKGAEMRYIDKGSEVVPNPEVQKRLAMMSNIRIRPFNDRLSTSKMEELQGSQVAEQKRTNKLLGNYKYFDGKKVRDLEGNTVERV